MVVSVVGVRGPLAVLTRRNHEHHADLVSQRLHLHLGGVEVARDDHVGVNQRHLLGDCPKPGLLPVPLPQVAPRHVDADHNGVEALVGYVGRLRWVEEPAWIFDVHQLNPICGDDSVVLAIRRVEERRARERRLGRPPRPHRRRARLPSRA